MTRQLRMVGFHVQQFLTVPFFVQVVIVSTLSISVVQSLAQYAWGGDCGADWIRAGIIGTWSTCTIAAGILGFERYKGTLVHLVVSRVNPIWPLAALVTAASVFALAAFPIAWLSTWALHTAMGISCSPSGVPMWHWLVEVALLWVAAMSVTFVVAALFVLTPNAIAYEELLLMPTLFLSGVLFTVTSEPTWLRLVGSLIPIRWPIRMLMGEGVSAVGVAGTLVVSAVWFMLAAGLASKVLHRARVNATLEVI